MPRLLTRAAAGEDDVVDNARVKWIALVEIGRLRRGDSGRGGDCLRRGLIFRFAALQGEAGESGGDPSGGGIVVVDVAVDARKKSRRPELLETPVESFA